MTTDKPKVSTAAKAKINASNISDASTPQILKFAEDEAGLIFDEGVSREYVLEQIFSSLQWIKQDPTDGATHVLMKISVSPEVGGRHPVRLGFRGRMMTLRRDVETEVPIEFYNVLMDINSLGYTIPPIDKSGKVLEGAPEERIQVTQYPVTVLKFINKGNAA